MCNRYQPPDTDEIRSRWLVDVQDFPSGPWLEVWPKRTGLFLRPGSADRLELVQARWQLVPSYFREPLSKFTLSTNNGRWENKIRVVQTFKPSWLAGRRCIIPARWFNEPNWESTAHVPWKFAAADGRPIGLAGLWNPWHSPTGEVVETYTLITINADTHELMRRMHRPGKEKRMVAVIDEADEEAWLRGSLDEAEGVIRQWPVEKFSAGPLVTVTEAVPVALDPSTGELF